MLIKSAPAGKSAEQQMQPPHRNYRKSHAQCEDQFARRQRYSAKHPAAKIDKSNLHGRDQCHNGKEGRVFSDPGKHPDAVGPGIETVQHPGKNEKRKKSGQQTKIILKHPEVIREKGQPEEADRKRDRERNAMRPAIAPVRIGSALPFGFSRM